MHEPVFDRIDLTDFLSFDKYPPVNTYQNAITDDSYYSRQWSIESDIGNNNYGPGNSFQPNLDGVPISKSKIGVVSYKNIDSLNTTLYPEVFNNTLDECRSYSGFPYASSVDNYYNGLLISRYTNNTQDANEQSLITGYNSIDKTFTNISVNARKIYYKEGQFIEISDFDTSNVVYSTGHNSCNLLSNFSENWKASDYWGIENTSLLNVSTNQKITIHGGSDVHENYTEYYIEDCTMPLGFLNSSSRRLNLSDKRNRFKKIVSYDGLYKKAILDSEFPIANHTTGYTSLIETTDYSTININPDRANPFES